MGGLRTKRLPQPIDELSPYSSERVILGRGWEVSTVVFKEKFYRTKGSRLIP